MMKNYDIVIYVYKGDIFEISCFWGFLSLFIAGRRQRPLLRQRSLTPLKAVQGGTGKDALRFSSPSSPLENPPFSRKSKLFLLGKKTVGFLSQPLHPKGEDSLRE